MKYFILTTLASLAFLTSCRTLQNAQKPSAGAAQQSQEQQYKAAVVAKAQTAQCVTAKINMDVDADGKQISCGGSLKMKRDDVIQLSLTFLGFEVGRLEFTPKDVLVVDRIHRQYSRASYAEVDFLHQAGLDFYALQSLFWNEIFTPGSRDVRSQLNRFRLVASGDYTSLLLTDAPKLNYQFLTRTSSALLDRVTVDGKTAADQGQFVWKYDNFTTLGGKPFPTSMAVSISGMGKKAGFTLALSRLNNDTDWPTRTTISSKYTQIKATSLLDKLAGMAQ